MVNNTVVLTGRFGQKPELKTTNTGKSVCAFRIAVSGYDGKTDWFDITAWEKTAEFICNNFEKGQLITIKGELHNREWTDRSGNKRILTEVIAKEAGFAGDKPKKEDKADEKIDSDDDLPF